MMACESEKSDVVVTVTERALAEIRARVAPARCGRRIVRFGVKGGGCAGYAFTLVEQDDDDVMPDDVVVDVGDVVVLVDRRSADVASGTTIDFVPGVRNHGFKFTNGRVVATCGCGASVEFEP